MKKIIFILLTLTSIKIYAHSQPWVVYGQTALKANSGINNPEPNINGLVGEQTFLPYVVPSGKQLRLTGWGFEGLKSAFGVTIPYIGTSHGKEYSLPSVGPQIGSYYVTGFNFIIPAGKIVNVRLLNGSKQNNIVCAWMVQGFLEDIK